MAQYDPVLEQMILSRMKQAATEVKLCQFGRVHATHVRCFDRDTRTFCRELPVLKEFNEDQPRDDHGRWSDSGGEGLPGAEPKPGQEGNPPFGSPEAGPQTEYRMNAIGELQFQNKDGIWVRNPDQPGDQRIGTNGFTQEMGSDGTFHELEVRVGADGAIEVRDINFGEWKTGDDQPGQTKIQDGVLYEMDRGGQWQQSSVQPGDERLNSDNGHLERMNTQGSWEQQTFSATGGSSQSGGGSGSQGTSIYQAPDSAPADPGAGRPEDHTEQAALREKGITEFEQRGTPGEDHVNPAYRVTFEDGTQAMWKPGPYYKIDSYNLPDGDNIHEQAASDLAHMMKYDDIVPHSVIRTVDGVEGSMQEWRNGSHGSSGISILDGKRSLAFDYMQGNYDRHDRNVLTTPDGKPVLIDNGLSMPASNTDKHGDSTLGLRTSFNVDTESKIPASVAKSAQGVLDSWEKSAKQLQRNGLSDSALTAMKERITAIATHKGSWQTLPHMQWG